jgi:hypothetical protein
MIVKLLLVAVVIAVVAFVANPGRPTKDSTDYSAVPPEFVINYVFPFISRLQRALTATTPPFYQVLTDARDVQVICFNGVKLFFYKRTKHIEGPVHSRSVG